MGSHLLFQLMERGSSVRAIYRDKSKLAVVRNIFSFYSEHSEQLFENIHWVEAHLNDLPSMERAFEDITHVYHCAAMISFDPGDLQALIRNNEVGTANLVNLCIARKIKKLCYVSSIAALGKNRNGSLINEDNEWRGSNSNPYALTKHLAEMEVWRGTQEGVPAVIVNPGVIIGPGIWNSGSGKLFRIASKGSRYHPPGGSGFVTVDDVVRMMIQLMESEVKNERFIAVGENLSYSQILSKLAGHMGRPKPSVSIPFWILKVLWRLDWIWHLISGHQRKLTRAQVDSLANRNFYDSSKTKDFIGFEYHSLEDCVAFSSKKFKEAYPSHFA